MEKSWGVYAHLQGGEHTYYWEGIADHLMSLSVQTPANAIASHLHASLSGPSVSRMECQSGWTGWEHRRLQSDTMVFDLQPGSLHFEPYGVGGYVSLGGCQARFVESGTYTFRIWGEGRYSLGAGMEESFSVDDILGMPIRLLQTFRWTGQPLAFTLIPFLLTLFLAWYGYRGLRWQTLIYWSALLLFQSSVLFAVQMIWLATLAVPVAEALVFPLAFHVLHPIVVGSFLLYTLRWPRTHCLRFVWGLLACVEAAACWLGMIVLPLFLFIAAVEQTKPTYRRIAPQDSTII